MVYSQWLAKALFRNLSLHNGLSACLYLCMPFLKKFEPTSAKYRKCYLRLLRYLKPWQKHRNPTPFTLTAQVPKVTTPSEEAWAEHVEVWLVGVLRLPCLMKWRFCAVSWQVFSWETLSRTEWFGDKENVGWFLWCYLQWLASALFRNLVTQWPFCL